MIRSIAVVIVCLLMVASGCSKGTQNPAATASPETPKISSETVVKVAVQPVEIPAGGSNEATVRLTIQPGYHINANPATYPYLKATELDVTDTDEISMDYTYYPNPQVKKFAFADQPLRVYEGEIQLKVLLNADKKAAKGNRPVNCKLSVQACDDKLCYPPATIDVVIPVVIK
ncbi:MAG: protein-disulfide reductase DsbD domain-containing protein [bacterium]